MHAQKLEFGIWAGGTNYFGDLNTNANFQLVGPGAGIFVRNNLGTRFSFRHSFLWGQIEGRDDLSKNEFQRERNLSFKSNVMELSTNFEFNFLDFWLHKKSLRFSPYISVGIAVFYFNPKAYYEGQWYELQPLGTEGQNDENYTGRKRYSLFQLAIPIGGGIKYAFDRNWAIGIDFGNRRTFTDYLDDVSTTYVSPISLPDGDLGIAYALSDRSTEIGEKKGEPGKQRGTSARKDDYFFFGITFSYTINSTLCPKPYGIY